MSIFVKRIAKNLLNSIAGEEHANEHMEHSFWLTEDYNFTHLL